MGYAYSTSSQVVRKEMLRVMDNFAEKENFGEDEKYRKKMIKAAKRMYNYYSVKEDQIK